jgi:hypothetical protein
MRIDREQESLGSEPESWDSDLERLYTVQHRDEDG